MTDEMTNALRICAVAGAGIVAVFPWLIRNLPSLPARVATVAKPLGDAHTVLEIAGRLQAAGNSKGVEICRSLIDVMIGGAAQK